MTEPTLLNLVSEQHPTLFPLRHKKDGRVENTSKRDSTGTRTLVRKPSDIVGIGIHQTACVFGPSDPVKKHRRALNIPAHVTAFRDGTYVQSAPLLWFLYHGHALNPFTLGLECEGQYPGLFDDPTTPAREDERSFWAGGERSPTPLDDLSIATFRAALKYLVDEGRKLGCPIQYIWAHRQSCGEKTSDPGAGIWQHVVEEYAIPVLGLKPEYNRTFRDGNPIPKGWAAGARAPY